MINLRSPRDSVGFHADPVVIVHSSESNGHSRRQKFITVIAVATLVLSALVIGVVLLAKNLSARSAKNASAHVDSTPKYLISFDPAISSEQMNILLEILKQSSPNSYITSTTEGGISVEGAVSALDDVKMAFKVAIDLTITLYYSITDTSTGETLFQHCTNPHDVRCASEMEMAPIEQCADMEYCDYKDTDSTDSNCAPGFKGPDCTDCIEGRYGPQCQFECGDCGRGVCNDGINGDGQCICPEGFAGNCKECLPGRYGPDCLQVCTCKDEWGMCDDGLNGTGKCTCINNHVIGDNCDRCDVGWTGAHCTLAQGSNGLNAFNYCGLKPQVIAITFDGWPTAEVLQELDDANFKATFFIRPASASTISCDLVKLALERGHGIQLGGFNGEPMNAMTAEQIDLQLRASLDWLEQCIGTDKMTDINQFRPPLGEFDNGRARYVTDLGYKIATWNVDGDVGLDIYQLYSQLHLLSPDSSILIRFDLDSYPVPFVPILSQFLKTYRSDVDKKFVLTKDCYTACTGGNGVCRTEAGGPGVFDTFKTIKNY